MFGFKKKKFLINEKDLVQLIELKGPYGCVVSDKIMVDGEKVGYMYRDIPEDDPVYGSDSGWRFMSGTEPKDYDCANDYEQESLNTVCNYDRDIIPFLDSPYETAYKRDETGKFVQVPYE